MVARVYATVTDYRAWVGDDSATPSAGVLARASNLVDEVLIGAHYAVDPDTLLPTEPVGIAALRDAVCAQVQFWDDEGNTTGVSGSLGKIASASIGSASYTITAGTEQSFRTTSGLEVGSATLSVLRVAGLWPTTPYVYG